MQSAVERPEAVALIRKLMTERGMKVPPANRTINSICVVALCDGQNARFKMQTRPAGFMHLRGDALMRASASRRRIRCVATRGWRLFRYLEYLRPVGRTLSKELKTGGLALDRPELADVAAHADVWEKVIRKVRTGMMPPGRRAAADAAERDALLSSLVATLDRAARRVGRIPAGRSCIA